MHDKALHAVARAIAENRDLMLGHVEVVKSELQEKIAAIEPGVNASFVENYVAKTESKLVEVVTENIALTVKDGLESLSELFHTTVEDVKVEAVGAYTEVKQLVTQVTESLTGEVGKALQANDDTLGILSKRFEGYDESITQLQEKQVAVDAGIVLVQESINTTDKNVLDLADSMAKATEELATEIEDVGVRVDLAKSYVDELYSTIQGQLKNELEIKQWTPGVYRMGVRVKCNFGDQYIANCDTVTEPSIGNSEWTLVQQGLRFKGLFSEEATYYNGDIIVKDGATWIHDGERLNIIAMRGEQGKRGQQGAKGETGESGLSETTIKSLVQSQLGDVHALTVDIAGETAAAVVKSLLAPPDSSAVPVKFFRGHWNGETAYEVGDQVVYVSSTYVCTSPNTGATPQGNNAAWIMSSPMPAGSGNIVAKTVDDLNQQPHLSQWTGTQAEYDALPIKDSSVFYTITDAPEGYISRAQLADVLAQSTSFAQFKNNLLAII